MSSFLSPTVFLSFLLPAFGWIVLNALASSFSHERLLFVSPAYSCEQLPVLRPGSCSGVVQPLELGRDEHGSCDALTTVRGIKREMDRSQGAREA